MKFDADHFRRLRAAKKDGYTAESSGDGVYCVPSKSNPKHAHLVNVLEGSCCCPAIGLCVHQALALDRFMFDDADTFTFLEYSAAQREDLAELIQRARADELKRDDKSYVRSCVKSIEAKIPRVEHIQESQPCPF